MTDSPYPQRTMEMIYQMRNGIPCFMIRGNRENYLLDNDQKSQNWKPSSSNGVLYYTATHITPRDLDFFRSLPEERIFAETDCPDVYLCHGTPGEVRGEEHSLPWSQQAGNGR